MRSARRGLTIIEVQVSLLILMVGILTAVGLAPMGMKGRDVAEKNTLAMAYARQLMESVRAMPYKAQKFATTGARDEAGSPTRIADHPDEATFEPVRNAPVYSGESADQRPSPYFWYRVIVTQIPAVASRAHDVCDGHDLHKVSVYIYYVPTVPSNPNDYFYKDLDQPLPAAAAWRPSDWSKFELYKLVSDDANL